MMETGWTRKGERPSLFFDGRSWAIFPSESGPGLGGTPEVA
jgi:hypothetical protein